MKYKGGEPIEPRLDNALLYERFYMPLVYAPEPTWAHTIEVAVEGALEKLRSDSSLQFSVLLEQMAQTGRTGLLERAEKIRDNKTTHNVRAHAEEFGVRREGSQRVTWIGGWGPLAIMKDEAEQVLKQFGKYYEEDGTWGQFSKRAGQPFKKHGYVLYHTYPYPKEKFHFVKLGLIGLLTMKISV